MSTNILWLVPTEPLTFRELAIGDHFVIDTPTSRGAVYRKVRLDSNVQWHNSIERDGMLEVATGLLFKPTASRIAKTEVEIKINRAKPAIY